MRRIVWLLTAVLTVFTCGDSQADWQITRFVMYEGEPSWNLNWREEEAGEDSPSFDPALVRDLESYMHAVAEHLAAMNFPDPVSGGFIDSVVRNREGQEAIRIYLHESSEDKLAWYTTPYPCNPKTDRRIMNINTATFGKGGKISDSDYATLAHELFHSIQAASPLFRAGSCKHGKWLIEGQADAIGHYMARMMRNAQFEEDLKNKEFLKVFGGRNYSLPLNKPPPDLEFETYGTSSFWRHLAEVSHASANGKTHQGSAPSLEDYTYLADFLNQGFTENFGANGEIAWLNRAMKRNSRIKNSLSHVYPRFVSALADHMDSRIPALPFVPDSERQEKWFRRIFGSDCEAVEMPGENVSVPLTIELEANASRCFTVTKPGTNSAALTIQLIDKDAASMEQLTIGMLDGTIVLKPPVRNHAAINHLNVKTWNFPQFGPYTRTYVISNVADSPFSTKKYAPVLQLSLGTWDSSMTAALTAPAPTPSPPPSSQPVPGPQQSFPGPQQPAPKPTKRQEQKRQLEEAVASPVEHLVPVTRLERKGYERPVSCDAVRLGLNLCGPQLVVTLQLSPIGVTGDIASLDQGAFGDFFTESFLQPGRQGGGVGPWDTSAMVELEQTLEGMDGSKIRISMPKIDYGFTGQFENAEIWVSRANGGDDDYLSYGPTVWRGGQRFDRPPNGRVTIDEYSPLVLRGTFSASLIDESDPGRSEAPIVATSISGSFMVTSAWMADSGFQVDEESLKRTMIESMMQESPFGTAVMDGIIQSTGGTPPQVLCDEGVDEEFLLAMGFTTGCDGRSGGGQVAQQCTCECDLRQQEEALAECPGQCGKEWNECPMPDEVASGSLEEQLEYCKKSMLKRGIPEGQIPLFMKSIRETPDNMRKQVMKSLC